MANIREELVNRFVAFSGDGTIQAATGAAMANADIDTRDKCTITREEVKTYRDIRDCRNQDLADSQILTRAARYTLVYAEVTPQIMTRWFSYFGGAAAAPTGSQANEVQTLTRTGTVSGGTFKLNWTLEGRAVQTKPIAWDASNADILAAVTRANMLWIHPGDVVIGGTWGSAITITFGGRLVHANIPAATITNNLTGSTPGLTVGTTTDGSQFLHALTRSTARSKVRFSFALGYEDMTSTIEKYADYVCESFQPSANLDGDPALTVSIIGPWEADSLEPTLTIPDCVNPTPLRTEDCKLEVNSVFQTADLNTMTDNLNDNVPLDRGSAFQYDGIDIQNLNRGRQPTYTSNASIFGLAGAGTDNAVAILAQNERTQAGVQIIKHYGLPGNRFSLIYPNAKVRFQNARETFVGTVEFSAAQFDFIPFVNGTAAPVRAEAYLDQATAFLTT